MHGVELVHEAGDEVEQGLVTLIGILKVHGSKMGGLWRSQGAQGVTGKVPRHGVSILGAPNSKGGCLQLGRLTQASRFTSLPNFPEPLIPIPAIG